MPPRSGFARLWLADTISVFGSQVSAVALPLTAVVVLRASVEQVSLTRAIGAGSMLVAALFAGVVVDRWMRKPILVWSNLGFALVMGSIPALAFAGGLRIAALYIVSAAFNVLSALSIVASQSFLPELVAKEELARANGKLQTTLSASSVVGPGAGGWLVEWLGAPLAICLDALTYLIAAILVASIPVDRSRRALPVSHSPIFAGIASGASAVLRHRELRPLAEAIAAHFLFAGLVFSVLIFFANRELGIPALGIGALSASAGAGMVLGSLLAPRMAARRGVGETLVTGSVLVALGVLAFPLAHGPTWVACGVLALGQLAFGAGIQIHGINLVSLRQAIVAPELLGRANATFRFLNSGAATLGALAAAALSSAGLAPRALLAVGAVGFWIPPLVLAHALLLRRPGSGSGGNAPR
ncbi:MAG TPA: MFS transporter [Myxococcota bacterium]|nr:MFS transporter [Myxococcota bacterium]